MRHSNVSNTKYKYLDLLLKVRLTKCVEEILQGSVYISRICQESTVSKIKDYSTHIIIQSLHFSNRKIESLSLNILSKYLRVLVHTYNEV